MPMSHRSRTVSRAALFLMAAAALMLVSCQRKGIPVLLGHELFSLSLGKMEDQLDLFQLEGSSVERTNSVCMRDGWFYLANGNAGKIMVFSSYGDLIFLLYNPQKNPAPTGLPPIDPNAPAQEITRGCVAYPFSDIGEIAVASDRTLYVEDAVTEAKAVKDDSGIILNRVIQRFDRKGKVLGYLGQEGIGGRPFPFISALHVTEKDQLVVVCRMPQSWQVYWYSRDGVPLYQVEIDNAHLPVRPQKGVTPVLVNVLPDRQATLLYLLVYFYNMPTEPAAVQNAAQDTVTARVYRLSLANGRYDPAAVEFPQNPPRREKTGLKTTEIPSPPSDLVGVSAGGLFTLMAYTDSNLYTLQILDPSGRVRARRHMVIEDSDLTFRDLRLSREGIIYGLLADQSRAHVMWWRSDMLLKGN
jgi:hypothetical protein